MSNPTDSHDTPLPGDHASEQRAPTSESLIDYRRLDQMPSPQLDEDPGRPAPPPDRRTHPQGQRDNASPSRPVARDRAEPTEAIEPFFTDQPPAQSTPDVPELGWSPPASDTSPDNDSSLLFGSTPDPALAYQPPLDTANGPEEQGVYVTRRRRSAPGGGWRKAVTKMTGGRVNPAPSAKQERAAELIKRIRNSLAGVHKVAFVNAKGGVGKTTMTVAVGNVIAHERGDRVIAVDVNTDLGNLSARFAENGGPTANIEHLASLQNLERYSNVTEHTVQNSDRLEMLGAQNDPRSSYTLNAQDYAATIHILETHYNVILLDCGTSITSPLFSTIVNDVTGLVVVAAQNNLGIREAMNTLRWLHAHGLGRLLQRTVVVLNATNRGSPLVNLDAAETDFRQRLSVPEVVRVPYDPHLAEGMAIELGALRPRTHQALMHVAGAVAEHYPARQGPRHRSDHSGGF